MKKTVKSLIIAASVAAVAGIGAVSFAAWSGATTEDVIKTGATGVINTLGELTVTADATSGGDTLKALVPYNQADTTPSDAVNYWKFTVELPDATGTVTPTYKLKAVMTKGSGGTDLGSANLYWVTTDPTSDTTGAVKINVENAATITLGSNGEGYVYLDASNTDAMNADITLTFSAE